MNVLCPDCRVSVTLDANAAALRCPACGLSADLSRLETSPGRPVLSLDLDLTGAHLGGYTLQALLGAGGMGSVYRAQREGEPRPVAVKVLHGDYHHHQEAFLTRFRREAQALSRLDHPGVVRLLGSGTEGDHHYLVTELVEGPSLAQTLRAGPLPVPRALDVLAQVAEALAYAHAQGVVHRDVKPANILLDGDRVKVVDFGLAQLTGTDGPLSSLTRTGLAMGTLNYLAPEQRTDAKQVDERADLFSLGVLGYELITGEVPLGAFAAPSRRRPGVPRRLDRLILQLLAVDPVDRPRGAATVAAELRRLARPARWSRRAWLGLGLALGIAGLGGAAAWAWLPGSGTPSEPLLPPGLPAPPAVIATPADAASVAAPRPSAPDAAVPVPDATVTPPVLDPKVEPVKGGPDPLDKGAGGAPGAGKGAGKGGGKGKRVAPPEPARRFRPGPVERAPVRPGPP